MRSTELVPFYDCDRSNCVQVHIQVKSSIRLFNRHVRMQAST